MQTTSRTVHATQTCARRRAGPPAWPTSASIASRREPGRHQQRPVLLRDDTELTANGVDSQTSGRKQPRGQGARFDPIRLRQTGGDRHREGREREHLDARRDENAASDSVAAARKPWRDEFVVSPLFMNRLRPERPRAL